MRATRAIPIVWTMFAVVLAATVGIAALLTVAIELTRRRRGTVPE